MPKFKLKKDELFQQWYRSFYEVEADSLEEAIQQVLEDPNVDPYDVDLLPAMDQEPIEVEILNEKGDTIYESSKQL